MKEEAAKALETLGLEEMPGVLREAAVGMIEPSVTIRDAKTHLSALLEWVSRGRALVITSDGKPKAKLVPASAAPPRKLFRGMGKFLLEQPIHGGPAADELVREDRDGRGW
jgi:prevent-host-death family protein